MITKSIDCGPVYIDCGPVYNAAVPDESLQKPYDQHKTRGHNLAGRSESDIARHQPVPRRTHLLILACFFVSGSKWPNFGIRPRVDALALKAAFTFSDRADVRRRGPHCDDRND